MRSNIVFKSELAFLENSSTIFFRQVQISELQSNTVPRTWLDREAWKTGKEDLFPNKKHSTVTAGIPARGLCGRDHALERNKLVSSMGPDHYQGVTWGFSPEKFTLFSLENLTLFSFLHFREIASLWHFCPIEVG